MGRGISKPTIEILQGDFSLLYLVGYSPIALAKNAIGISIACEEYGASFFGNGASPSGVLEHPGVIKNPERVRDAWQRAYGGRNAHKVAVLEETLIAPTALMMIHDPSTCAMGNKADMEKAIILLDEVKESIINAYETKSHLSRNKIAKLMSDETWLNAKKAHEMGFVDGILFAEKKMPVVPKEEEPDEEEKEDTLTAMTYSKSKNLSAFFCAV